ncbi:MAG: phytanoyl-CoA dioxygenase family protein [Gammaproteobacteria bacterium]|nr:phytanoyl-CoA dioxygenase family protein [Gammaproteobacteria bacterium]
MNVLKETIKETGYSSLFRISWSTEELAALRIEGAEKLQTATYSRAAQFDLHLSWPRLMNLVTDKAITARLSEVFEEDSLQLVETRLYPKLPQSGVNWHIDIDQLQYFEPSLLSDGSGDFHSITTWLALGDVPVEMGALQAVHYRHIDLHRLVETNRSQQLSAAGGKPSRRYQEICAEEAQRLRDHIKIFPMKAGEFCLFDPRNLHTGGANVTNQIRLGMVLRYCASRVKVNPKFSKKRKLQITPINCGSVESLQ